MKAILHYGSVKVIKLQSSTKLKNDKVIFKAFYLYQERIFLHHNKAHYTP